MTMSEFRLYCERLRRKKAINKLDKGKEKRNEGNINGRAKDAARRGKTD